MKKGCTIDPYVAVIPDYFTIMVVMMMTMMMMMMNREEVPLTKVIYSLVK